MPQKKRKGKQHIGGGAKLLGPNPPVKVLKNFSLVKHATPDAIDYKQRMHNLAQQQRSAEEATHHRQEMDKFVERVARLAPGMRRTDVILEAGRHFKKKHGFKVPYT